MRVDEVQPHTPFVVKDYWSSDAPFRFALARQFSQSKQGKEYWPELSKRLEEFSLKVEREARPLAKLCDRPNQEPRLVQFNEWGQRIDSVETSEGWRGLLQWQMANGIVSESYPAQGQEDSVNNHNISAGGRDRLGEIARMYNFARTLIFTPDSQVAVCPTSMTDGAARVLELYGTSSQKQKYLPKLFGRTPDKFWLSGQWMTEVAGGSDVSMTETVAEPLISRSPGQKAQPGDLYIVNGFKWFSSAADGNMTLALARTDSDRAKGSKGLSLFLIPLHKKDRAPIPTNTKYTDQTAPTSKYNGIKVHRLKNKLGTKHVPTAELEICGAVAELIGEEGRGVAQIAQVLNITRTYCISASTCSIGVALQILQDYANRRKVGVHGQAETLLKDLPLHNTLIAKVAIHYRAMLQLHLNITRLLGKNEAKTTTEAEERRLRLLTPVGKAFGAVRASDCLAQSIECLGGQGYMHETILTTALRDDFVSRIWEGTPSVLSLDVVRVHAQTKGAALIEWLQDSAQSLQRSNDQLQNTLGQDDVLTKTVSTLRDTLREMKTVYLNEKAFKTASGTDMRLARPLLDSIAIVECGCQLLNQAAWSTQTEMQHGNAKLELQIASRWVCGPEGGLAIVRNTMRDLAQGKMDVDTERHIAYGLDHEVESLQTSQSTQSSSNRSSNTSRESSILAKSKL
ncbi:uncharacterized protein FA14DRAFT_155643 [Meira miltonrushii]|uniref:Acyl-CoA dehydrogenase NM domain-like protein n=1 Tax=Meira miltonrushii TaxID=1280837 RepID=A0A316VGS8_9BASI|nr:uncharacterized protein FA14DRAFT_155643 [Meira miltonrushii]PWN36238.1 hypothetical protein FA14DRAFT_155643 [Meira miltonrushii]